MSFPYSAFSPYGSVSVTASSTSVTTQVPGSGIVGSNIDTLRIVNTGTVVAYIAFGGDSTVTASVNSIALLPGVIEVFDPASSATGYFAVFAASGSPSINVTSGAGA
jgi:hypothetical protein